MRESFAEMANDAKGLKQLFHAPCVHGVQSFAFKTQLFVLLLVLLGRSNSSRKSIEGSTNTFVPQCRQKLSRIYSTLDAVHCHSDLKWAW